MPIKSLWNTTMPDDSRRLIPTAASRTMFPKTTESFTRSRTIPKWAYRIWFELTLAWRTYANWIAAFTYPLGSTAVKLDTWTRSQSATRTCPAPVALMAGSTQRVYYRMGSLCARLPDVIRWDDKGVGDDPCQVLPP